MVIYTKAGIKKPVLSTGFVSGFFGKGKKKGGMTDQPTRTIRNPNAGDVNVDRTVSREEHRARRWL